MLRILVVILFLIFPLINSLSFELYNDSCINQPRNEQKIQDALIYIYHPKRRIDQISFSKEHYFQLSSSYNVVTLRLVIKDKKKHLLHVIYSDSSRDHQLFDLYYKEENGTWKDTNQDEFNWQLATLAGTFRTFDILKWEDWFSCSQGLTDTKLCSIEPYYMVNKVNIGNATIWNNENNQSVYAIGVSVKRSQEEPKLLLRVYYLFKGRHEVDSYDIPLTPNQFELIQNSIDSEFILDEMNFRASKVSTHVNRMANSSHSNKIRLDIEPETSNGYKVKHYIAMGFNVLSYEPNAAVEVKSVRYDQTVIWSTSDNINKFIHASFSHRDDLLLLNVRTMVVKSKCMRNTKEERNEYFIKLNSWNTITEADYQKVVNEVMNNLTLKVLEKGASHESLILPDEGGSKSQGTVNQEYKNRLNNIKLAIDQGGENDYNKSVYLMDGLETYFFDPKKDKIVTFVKEGSTNIWSSDDKKRILKHAKFQYKKDSPIYLQVLYSTHGHDGTQPISNNTDYFIKKDQWYHSPQDDFFTELDKLINRVTMRDVIENESKSLEDHIQSLDFTIKGPEPGLLDKIMRKKQTITKLKPFEFDIQEDGKDQFSIEANIAEKFAIYTPNKDLALTRIFDKDRLIWYQEVDGRGCITLYMDLSGTYPLLHLVLDDPKNSDMYYKKMDNNWYMIDKNEYEEIRKPPNGQPTQNDFVQIS